MTTRLRAIPGPGRIAVHLPTGDVIDVGRNVTAVKVGDNVEIRGSYASMSYMVVGPGSMEERHDGDVVTARESQATLLPKGPA